MSLYLKGFLEYFCRKL